MGETLWRYVDIPSLIWLLQERKLFFRDPRRFPDPFEFHYPKPVVEDFLAMGGEVGKHNRRFFQQIDQYGCFVSCWHAHDHESVLMWRAYATNVGAAVQTTRTRLQSQLPSFAKLWDIKYIDYEKDRIPTANMFDPLVHKRLQFMHECEVRAIAWAPEIENSDLVAVDRLAEGVAIACDPEELIEQIVLSPDLSWFAGTMNSIMGAFGLNVPVRTSSIRNEPYTLFKRDIVEFFTPWEHAEKVRFPRYVFTDPPDTEAAQPQVPQTEADNW